MEGVGEVVGFGECEFVFRLGVEDDVVIGGFEVDGGVEGGGRYGGVEKVYC